MYNDEVMVIYMLLTIYFSITKRPIYASIFLAIAMSIKLTAIFLIPAFMGITMANYGVPMLFKSIGIILVLQIIVALPFLVSETDLKTYFLRCIKYHDKDFPLTSTKTGSIFFTFLPDHIYYGKHWGMMDIVRVLALSLTVYHFFIRKMMLKPCLDILMDSWYKNLEGIKTQARVRLTTEILVLGFYINVILMPGAHSQF